VSVVSGRQTKADGGYQAGSAVFETVAEGGVTPVCYEYVLCTVDAA
jgi:hypothetical protein